MPLLTTVRDQVTTDDLLTQLEMRLGRVHARQRLGIERDHETRVAGSGLNLFQVDRWYSAHSLVRTALQVTGLYGRGSRNAADVCLRRNVVHLPGLPRAFDGLTILQLSDLHTDMSAAAMERLIEMLPGLTYDLVVLTGDFRGKTFGGFDGTIDIVARILRQITAPVYGVLGNHDSIRMLQPFEAIGIRMLMNEAEPLVRGGARLHLAGIDDAHFFRTHNIEKAAASIPPDETSILLSHTPEIYDHAAHAGFDLFLCGHTHGGQICLPGGTAVFLDSVLPRRMGRGAWRFHAMAGYTSAGVGSSLVPVRFNCPPEITLHRLQRVPATAVMPAP